MQLDGSGRLWAEIIALRIMVGHLLARSGAPGQSRQEHLSLVHRALLVGLGEQEIEDAVPGRAEAIRSHAEAVIDAICTPNVHPI